MRKRLLFAIPIFGALCQPGCNAQVPAGVRAQFEEVAKNLQAFPPEEKFYVVPGAAESSSVVGAPMDLRMELARGWPVTPGAEQYNRLMQANYSVADLLSLLKDSDAKVRTLAAAALVAKGDPRLQRELGVLLDDKAQTFDVIATYPTDNYTPPHHMPQTVGVVALRLAEKPSREIFENYWRIHGGREYCADWFLWQFHRPEFVSIARQGIGNLPSPDRELITLWIGSGHSDFQNVRFSGYTEAELLAAAKKLGRENLLAVLRNQPATTDPDIFQDGSAVEFHEHDYEMGLFLLAHAKDLLEPSDADALLALETAERNRKNSHFFAYEDRWAAAAARLRPKEANAILDSGETRWPSAPNLALARWELLGPTSLPKILGWFYRLPGNQEALPLAIERTEPNESYRALVAAILASDGRLKINGQAMYRFAMLSQKWKVDFDAHFVDWIFAQSPDPTLGVMGPPRRLVVDASGVARKLVLDKRLSKADGQLLYVVEQRLVGTLKLTKAQANRLDQLIRETNFGDGPTYSESALQEIRNLLRAGVGASAAS